MTNIASGASTVAPGDSVEYDFAVNLPLRPRSLIVQGDVDSFAEGHVFYELEVDGVQFYDRLTVPAFLPYVHPPQPPLIREVFPATTDPGPTNPGSAFPRAPIIYPMGDDLTTHLILAGPDLYREQIGQDLGTEVVTYFPAAFGLHVSIAADSEILSPADFQFTISVQGGYQATKDVFWPEPAPGECGLVPRPVVENEPEIQALGGSHGFTRLS